MAGIVRFFQSATGRTPVKPHHPFKMLLIGETGSGKTSFLNLFCNCGTIQALGCKYDADGLAQFRQFNDVKLENAKSCQMESKTSGAKLYNIELGELKVGVIDTPGFGDSRGMKEDEENVKKIIEALQNEEYINCVCLIINGRQARMSATLGYVMSEITAILPREILNNIIVVFSNTADALDLNFDPTVLETFFGQRVKNILCIENPYCRFEKAKQKQKQLSIEMIAKSLKKSFEDTADVLDEMYTIMKKFDQVHTHRFITLYKKKEEIERRVQGLLAAYDRQENIREMIEEVKMEVDVALKKKNLNAQFKTRKTINVPKTVSTSSHNTLCGYPKCYHNCHIECGLSKSFDKEAFLSCACMSGSYCNVCNHHYTYHFHNEVKWIQVTETQDIIAGEMKSKFEEAETQEERAKILHKTLEMQLDESKIEKKRLSEELLSVMEEFQELGINRNYAKLLESQLAVIKERAKGTVGPENEDIKKTKEKLEKKLKLVRESLK